MSLRCLRVVRLGVLAVALGPACASSGPSVAAGGLALRRVVIYRNGVGYFQRAGHVEADQVRFKVRGGAVGDFLATFAVMEQGGSSVRAASFPLQLERGSGGDDGKPVAHKPELETVTMSLDGRGHDLEVGYVTETPVWRPSYRLVIDKDGADLQAWGVVQNLSGEDWNDVRLSLVAEAPLAFQAQLGVPVIPERPTVTDGGDVIAVVPRSETSLAEEPPPPPPAPAPAAAAMAQMDADEGEVESKPAAKSKRANVGAVADARGDGPMAPKGSYRLRAQPGPMAGGAVPSRTRNVSALAAVAAQAGATRYDLPAAVSIPNDSATMVLLVDRRVPGEQIFLWAPDGGVPESAAHPFRVARFSNKTGGLLEKGPIAVFADGAFLGQGLVDPLPDGATTTVPFALERSLAVEVDRQYVEENARLAHIEAGVLVVERDVGAHTRYKAKNGGDKAAKLLVKHARNPGARLVKPPAGTEDNVGSGSALIPLTLAAHATVETFVDERQGTRRQIDWESQLADDAVRAYLGDPRADAAVAAPLRAAWDVRKGLVASRRARAVLAAEQAELGHAAEETRGNLKAIEKNKAADDLRRKLTDRLAKTSARLDDLAKRLVELDLQLNEQTIRFRDTLSAIKLREPLPAKD